MPALTALRPDASKQKIHRIPRSQSLTHSLTHTFTFSLSSLLFYHTTHMHTPILSFTFRHVQQKITHHKHTRRSSKVEHVGQEHRSAVAMVHLDIDELSLLDASCDEVARNLLGKGRRRRLVTGKGIGMSLR